MTNLDRIKNLLGVQQFAGLNLLRKARAIVTGLPMLAQAFVEQSGKKVRIARQNSPGGKTDGKTIWISDAPLPSNANDLDRFLLMVAIKVGLLHHEIGHVNETDFEVKRPGKAEPLVHDFTGIIEDVRQENRRIAKVKSARRYLDALSLAMMELGFNATPPATASTTQVFTAYLLYYLRKEFRGEAAYDELVRQTGAMLEDRFTAGFRVRLEVVLEEMADLRSTTDSLRLARQVRQFLQEESDAAAQQAAQQAAQNNAQQAQGSGNGQGQSAQGQGNPSPQATSNNDPSDSTTGSSQGSGNGQQSDDQNTDGDAESPSPSADPSPSGDDVGDDLAPDQLEALQQALKDLLDGKDADTAMGDRDQDVRSALDQLQGEIERTTSDVAEVDMESIEAAAREVTSQVITGRAHDLDATVQATTRLKSRLRQVLQAQSITRTGRSHRGASLDVRALHRIPVGDLKIFKSTTDGITVDTSVFLLVDVSGSMDGSKIALASQAMFAAAMAMQSMPGVEVACGAFPGRQIVLPFGARAQRERLRFHLSSHGYTPMHEGVVMAHRALKVRRNPRKLLVVLTDGEPDSMAMAQATLDNVSDDGIDVYAIGIQTDYVQHLFPGRWAAVHDINELPEALMSVLRAKLLHVAA